MTAAASDIILDRLTSLHPRIIDLTLDRVVRLLDALDNPEQSLPPVIHIAGTNGKGSTAAITRKALESAGMTVHTYTSPHLTRFHERIRVAGALIPEDTLIGVLEECEQRNAGNPITVFEITTCAALLAFARTPADYTILEVGLGGRLDATNVIDSPAVSVITPVSIDHQHYLGSGLADIAREKAGILKRNALAVIGPQEQRGLDVMTAVGAEVGATLKVHGHHWHVWDADGSIGYQDEYGALDLPRPGLPGPFQTVNAGCAIAALRLLRTPAGSIAAGLADVSSDDWPARLHRMTGSALFPKATSADIWLDGGHNPAAGRAVADALAEMPPRSTHLVCGMLNTKDPRQFLENFAGRVDTVTGVTITGEAASRSADDIAEAARSLSIPARTGTDVLSAVHRITADVPDSRILVCGSLYLAGELLRSTDAACRTQESEMNDE